MGSGESALDELASLVQLTSLDELTSLEELTALAELIRVDELKPELPPPQPAIKTAAMIKNTKIFFIIYRLSY